MTAQPATTGTSTTRPHGPSARAPRAQACCCPLRLGGPEGELWRTFSHASCSAPGSLDPAGGGQVFASRASCPWPRSSSEPPLGLGHLLSDEENASAGLTCYMECGMGAWGHTGLGGLQAPRAAGTEKGIISLRSREVGLEAARRTGPDLWPGVFSFVQ